MSTQVQHRRGTTVQHASFTGAAGEITVDTTKNTAVVHDGLTPGGIPLAREDFGGLTGIIAGIAAGTSELSFRNRLINGAMAIDQRNSGASQTFIAAAAIAYCVDRWYGYCTGANCTGQQIGSGAAPSQYKYRFTGAATVTGINFGQRIKAADVYDLTSGDVVLSCKLANSLLTTVTWKLFYANAVDNFTTKTQIATGTFTVTSTLTKYSTVIAVGASALNGLCVELSVGSQTSGTWDITEVQLEPGSQVSIFERRPQAIEWQLCKHYYQKVAFDLRTYMAFAGGGMNQTIEFPEMRAIPTSALLVAGTVVNANTQTCTPGSTHSAQLQQLGPAVGDCYSIGRVYSLTAEL